MPRKDQLVLSGIDEVFVIDLKTGVMVKHLKIPEFGRTDTTYVSKNGARFFLFSSQIMQVWDTEDWALLRQLKAGRYHNDLGGFSENEELLFFAGTLWSGNAFEAIHEVGFHSALTDADFSPDNRYFIGSDHHVGFPITDIENRKWSGITYFRKGASQVSFRDNDSFYASYGASIDLTRNGYFSKKLGLFAVAEKDQIGSFSPSEKITCWVNDPQFGLLVGLYNGNIYLLDRQLDIQHKWHMDDFVRSCEQAGGGEVWLGGEKNGLYKADLRSRAISHEYETGHPVYQLKISPDRRYLGFEESLTGESRITVLYLNP